MGGSAFQDAVGLKVTKVVMVLVLVLLPFLCLLLLLLLVVVSMRIHCWFAGRREAIG